MRKPGVARPLVIPMHDVVAVGTLKSNLRTAGLTNDEFLDHVAGIAPLVAAAPTKKPTTKKPARKKKPRGQKPRRGK
jgi:hypothetical protein